MSTTFSRQRAVPSYTALLANDGSPPTSVRAQGWGIYWVSPLLMIGSYVLGLAFAIGHHGYYRSLHGTDVMGPSQQEKSIRYGTAIAFLTKSTLAASVLCAYSQRIWTTLRSKSISVRGINAVFSVGNNPAAFSNIEMLTRAKMVSLLALSAWLLPLSALITPATLSVVSVSGSRSLETEVPTLNMDNSTMFVAYEAGINGAPDNTTASGVDVHINKFWIFNGPSTTCSRYVTAVSSVAAILPMVARFSNYTYMLNFNGPSVKCRPANQTEIKLVNQTWEGSSMAHHGFGYDFLAIVPGLSDNGTLVAADLSGNIADETAIAMEMWYSIFIDPTGDDPSYISSSCQLYNASYSVQFDYSKGQQRTQIKGISYNDPIPASGIDYDEGFTTKQDPSQSPQQSFTYQAIAIALYQQIVGYIYASGTTTKFKQTLLAAASDARGYSGLDPGLRSLDARNLTMDRLIEELSQNITLSLFSVPEFLKPQNESQTANVTVYENRNIYFYNARNLWLSYGIAILVAGISVLIGCRAFQFNGVSHDTNFAALLCATRNKSLDVITRGQCLAAHPLDSNLGDVKLTYGVVRGEKGEGLENQMYHVAFGLEGEIEILKKGQECY